MGEKKLTKDLLKKIAANECIYSCSDCPLCDSKGAESCRAGIARILLAERAEREKNPGVWDDAPEWATEAWVQWRDGLPNEHGKWREKPYTRTLPKTKTREIAEKWAGVPTPTPTRPYLADVIESAILEALQSEGKK